MPRASDYLTSPRSVELRRNMVDRQLRTFDITNDDVLDAVLRTPREPFVNSEPDSLVYSDASLVVKSAHTARPLLAPMFVARALQLAEVASSDRVLDVAGASGYSAAIAARLCQSLVALEDDDAFVARSGEAFQDLGLANARSVRGSIAVGPEGDAVFDVILINGAIETRPDALLARLAEGGRLLAIEAGEARARAGSRFVLFTRSGVSFGKRPLFGAVADVLPAFAAKPEFVF